MEQILMNNSKKILFETRLSRLRARMTEVGTDLVAVGPTSNMAWLAGVSAHGDERPVMVLVTQKDAAFLMPALNQDSVRQHTDLPFYCWADADGANERSTRCWPILPLREKAYQWPLMKRCAQISLCCCWMRCRE